MASEAGLGVGERAVVEAVEGWEVEGCSQSIRGHEAREVNH